MATNRRYVPSGGASSGGRILTKGQVTSAVQNYARRHGYYVRTVRTISELRRAAVAEYVAGNP